nr:immunoglobulin light chain junction region [Macaca mulatta]MOW42360.1 immunoglobulin light chain junction region [Macaca mulatta]MOW45356.1 immunoglobulin light chain junction region [Macaca mulatta]
CQQGSDFPLTF